MLIMIIILNINSRNKNNIDNSNRNIHNDNDENSHQGIDNLSSTCFSSGMAVRLLTYFGDVCVSRCDHCEDTGASENIEQTIHV